MAKCCNDNLSKIFCNTYNKYYNTLYTNGEISKKETENLLVISYIRKLFINPRYIDYRPILIKALRCIANRSCLLDSSELYGRLDIKTVGDKFVTVLMRDIYSIKETDPTVPLYVKDIKLSDITNWNNKLSLETDPIFSTSPAATITNEDINNWNNPSASGMFVVPLELDSGSYYTTNECTFDDIYEAWLNDLDIVVVYSNGVYQLCWIEDSDAYFFKIDNSGGPVFDCFSIDAATAIDPETWRRTTINLQLKLTFDNNPTQNSNNPVESGGVYTALNTKQDKMLIATVTITSTDGSTYYDGTLDKTHSEIFAAMQANKNVYIYIPTLFNGTYVLLSEITANNNHHFIVVINGDLWWFASSRNDLDNSCSLYKFNYQAALVSGTNIKTVNNTSILDSGNLELLTPNFCPIIEDTRSQATDVNITGAAPFATLAGGQRIVLHFKYANTASPTLQLTLSGGTTTLAYPLYQNYNNGVNALTLQAMPAGSYGEFVFDSTNSRWVLIGKDFNTTYSATYQADINNSAQGSRLIEPKLLRDNFYLKSEVNNICPIIEDTRSSAVAAITGVAPFSTLVGGQRIIVHLNNATANSTTINLTLSDNTTTGAKPLYSSRNGQVSQVGSNYGLSGAYIYAIYSSDDNRWNALPLQDTNTTYPAIGQSNINQGTNNNNGVITSKLLHDNAYIVETTYSSGSLKANKMYDFGTVSSALTIPSLDATNDLVSNALNFYALRFIAGADNLNITFPTGVQVDDTPTINTGDYVEIMINKYGSNFYASIKVWQAQ